MARRWRPGLALVGLLVALTACTVPQVQAPWSSSAPASSAPLGSAPLSSAPPSGSSAAASRPLAPIPDVRTSGFAAPPPGEGVSRYTVQPVDWRPCGQGVVCAMVLTPLDWERPDGTAITLALAKVPASAQRRQGTLFVDPGGPGGSGVDFVRGFRTGGLNTFDLVGWDPRGVGRSTPVGCFGAADLDRFTMIDISPDDAAERSALLAADRAFGASCLARSGALLQHVSTAETVRDLDLLRQLVGGDKINYLGLSYGTAIGALYADRYPARVGRMVLDGAVDLTGGRSVSQNVGFERALQHFAADCVARSCRLGSSAAEVLTLVTEVLAGLDQRPLPGRSGRSLSQQQGVQAVYAALNDAQTGWAQLETGLAAARAGDGTGLLRLADRANDRRENGAYGPFLSAFASIRCLDSRTTSVAAAEQAAAADNAAAPVLGPFGGPDLQCTQWPVAPAAEIGRITATGAPPVVVVGTTGDPATPYEWAVAMSRQLDSAVLVTLAGEGHTAYGQSRCVRRLVQDYLVEGRLPADGSRC